MQMVMWILSYFKLYIQLFIMRWGFGVELYRKLGEARKPTIRRQENAMNLLIERRM